MERFRRARWDVQYSTAFLELLSLVMVVGNELNTSKTTKPAQGCTLASVLKLLDTRAFQSGSINLFHYVAKVAEEQMPWVLRLPHEFTNVFRVTMFSFDELVAEVGDLESAHMAVEAEVVSIRCSRDAAAASAEGANARRKGGSSRQRNGGDDDDDEDDEDAAAEKRAAEAARRASEAPPSAAEVPSAAELSAMGAFNIIDMLNEAIMACSTVANHKCSIINLQLGENSSVDIFGNEDLVQGVVESCLTLALERSPEHSEITVTTASPRRGLLQVGIPENE